MRLSAGPLEASEPNVDIKTYLDSSGGGKRERE